jgi:hypothetical protein
MNMTKYFGKGFDFKVKLKGRKKRKLMLNKPVLKFCIISTGGEFGVGVCVCMCV